ncbi:MAG: NAD(P)-dependent oxidoreductase [Desulfovibrio sp.]
MNKPLAVYYDILSFMPSSLEMLRERFELYTFVDPDAADPEVLARAQAVFAPKGFAMDAAALDKHPRLRAIGTPTTGEVHIDVEAARARGVSVCSLKNERDLLLSITPTAELAWGMVIWLVRHVPNAQDMLLKGQWDGRSIGARTPRMLSRLRLGVIGLGRLGALVAGYGKALGMEVCYFDPFVESSEFERCADVVTLATKSDVVSVHVHLTSETDRFLNADFFRALPCGSYFVNTARGEVVDEPALLEALRSGHLAGAAVDTLTGEHLPGFEAALPDNPMQRYAQESDSRLLLFPRYGGCTADAWELTEQRVVEKMHAACTAGGSI